MTMNESSPQPASNADAGGCRRLAAPLAVLAGLMLIAGVGLGIYVFFNFRAVSATFVANALSQSVNQSAVPDDQRKTINAAINDVRERYTDGRITDRQLKAITDRVFNDPAINAGLFYFAAREAVAGSPIDSAKQARLERMLGVFFHGVAQGKIDPSRVEQVAPLVSERGRPKTELSKADLETLARSLEAVTGGTKVQDADKPVDVAAQFQDAVDGALAQPNDGPDG